MKLVFASANKNKIREISSLLPEGYTMMGLSDIGITWEIPEPGTTIAQNSFLKARCVADFLKEREQNLPVFADDSGLEVPALDNAPGVYSARYAGYPKSDAANNDKLLRELAAHTNRKARFVTVITFINGQQVHTFEGEIKGTIAYEPRGTSGFGYDPLFIPRGYRSTFGELGDEVKNSISHRAVAFKSLAGFLKNTGLEK